MSTAIQMGRLGSNPLHTRANSLPPDWRMEQGQEQNMRPSEERDSASQERRVAITAWRLLNTIAILAVGSYKAATMNMVQTPGLTRVDWIVAAIWGLCAYWGGVVEQQVPTIAPWLFLRDFSGVVWFILQIPSKVIESPLWYLAYLPYACFSGYAPTLMLCLSAVAPGLTVQFLFKPGFRPLFRRFAPAVFWRAYWGISLPKAVMVSLTAVPVNVALTVLLLYGHAKTHGAVSRTALFAGATLGSLLTAYLAVSVVQMGWRLFRQHAASRR